MSAWLLRCPMSFKKKIGDWRIQDVALKLETHTAYGLQFFLNKVSSFLPNEIVRRKLETLFKSPFPTKEIKKLIL